MATMARRAYSAVALSMGRGEKHGFGQVNQFSIQISTILALILEGVHFAISSPIFSHDPLTLLQIHVHHREMLIARSLSSEYFFGNLPVIACFTAQSDGVFGKILILKGVYGKFSLARGDYGKHTLISCLPKPTLSHHLSPVFTGTTG
jgi:hypothetical protein